MNYYRITAYNKDEDLSIIMDCYGAYDSLGDFSSLIVSKGFSIIAIGNHKRFNDGDIPKVNVTSDKIILRAEAYGPPLKEGNKITVGDKSYSII